MASSIKINRRTVRQVVRSGVVTGTSLEACAANIVRHLELGSCCYRKTHEVLEKLIAQNEMVLSDSVLRLTTREERRAISMADTAETRRRKATRQRTATQRHGGMRTLQLRTTKPLPLELTS